MQGIRPPKVLEERYEILSCLGTGGMGAVFEARDRGTGQLLAIKTLLTAGRSNHMERFAREARILSRIDHPHVVRIVDFGEADGVPYLAMERLDGDNLSKVRPEGDPLPLLLQVAEAIEALHAAGIVHRDVKLANVQRTTGGRAVLLDFGLARTSDSTRLTRTGQVMGTMGCLAPELLAGREATPASDWYAFGVMLFELLEGRPPYSTRDFLAACGGAALPTPRPDHVPADSPQGRLLAALLSPEPARRPASVKAIREFLQGRVPVLPVRRALGEGSMESTQDVVPAGPRDTGPPAGGGDRDPVAEGSPLSSSPAQGPRASPAPEPPDRIRRIGVAGVAGLAALSLAIGLATGTSPPTARSGSDPAPLASPGSTPRPTTATPAMTRRAPAATPPGTRPSTDALLVVAPPTASDRPDPTPTRAASPSPVPDPGRPERPGLSILARLGGPEFRPGMPSAPMAFVGDGARVLVGGESPRVFSLPSGVPEDGETVLGEAWAELDVTADASRRLARASSPPLGLRISGIDRDPAPFLLPRIPEFPALQNHFVPILLSQDGRWAALHPTRGARMVPLVEGMGSVRRLPAPPRGEGEEEDREGMAGATLSPKGDVLVTFDRRGLLAWDTASGAGLARLPLTRSSSGMPAFSPAGDRVLFGLCFEGGETPRRSVVLSWDPRKGGRPSEVVSWADPTSCLHAVSVSRDGKILAATDGMAIQTWTLADGKRHRTLESGPSGIWAIRVSPDNRFLVAWGDAGNHVWSLETGRILSPPLVHSGRITSLAFDSTGARLVAVGGGRMVQWDVARATPSVAHDGPLNGGPLGGGFVDGDAGLWMVESVFEGPGSPDSSSIRRRRYSATSSSGIGTSYRGGVSDFGGRLRQAFSRDGSMVVEVVKTPQGEMAYISRVGAASVEDAKDEPVEPGSPFALAPRGKWLAAVQPGKDQLLVTDVVSGNDWYELPVRGGRLQALAITDTWTVAAAVPGAIEFFHQEKVADPAAIPVDPTPAVLAFSDDERWLAAASGSLVSVARLGKAPEWLRAETRQGGWASRVEILAFDRTGSRLAAGHRDGSITVFSLPIGPAAR